MNKGGPLLHVMEVERFAIHDGPGIRSVVFLQGCPLRCPWCANPESQQVGRHLMFQQSKCLRCGACAAACPHRAVEMGEAGPTFRRQDCRACGACAKACPGRAIRYSGEVMAPGEVMAQVLRDRDYYEESGGGVTFSGGEPFVQHQGLMELLRQSKAAGLHTAVETTGQVPPERLREAMPLIDLFLFDMKHPDPRRLAQVAKGDLGLILENLEWLGQSAPQKVTLRAPVIPGFNFDGETIGQVFRLALANRVERVDLLPYHTLGKNKYAQLGMEYPMWEAKALDQEELLSLQSKGQALGLAVGIGG